MSQVRVSREAADYIRQETTYLRHRNPSAAHNFTVIVKRAKETLMSFQGAGNAMHGLHVAGGLTLVIGDYLFDYTREGDVVSVLAVRHSRTLPLTPESDEDNDQGLDIEELAVDTSHKFK